MLISGDSSMESDREYLLALLNQQIQAPPFGVMHRVAAPPPLKYSLVPVDPKMSADANRVFNVALRSLVDQWLDSGRSGNVETPRERNLGVGTHGRDDLWFLLNSWVAKDRFRWSFTKSGEIELSLPCRQSSNDALADANNDAIRLFAMLLQSSLRYRIAQCRKPECGRYFYYERLPKGTLKCGTLCPEHKIHGGTVRKERQRKAHKERLLSLAAAAWPRWKPAYGERSLWIAGQVNRRLAASEQRITRKFVTQNDGEIQKRTEEQNA